MDVDDQRRITVWYAEEGKDAPPKAWHGSVVRLCINKGFQVRFDDWPDDHPDKTMWVSRTDDDWAWGLHIRRPSLKAKQNEDTAYNHGKKRARHDEQSSAPPFSVAHGRRSWTGAWLDCLNLLEELRCRILASVPSSKARSLRLLTFQAHAATSDGLDAEGMTHLTNGAVSVLQAVPTKASRGVNCVVWSSRAWPSNGDWSARIREAHTPEALRVWLKMARDEVIKWPASESAAYRASEDEAHEVTSADDHSRCFVCGHTAGLYSHPRPVSSGPLCDAKMCEQCVRHFESVHGEMMHCDDELLRTRCGACGHKGAAPHGCRACGESLCERCIHSLHGAEGLHGARHHRFYPELCAGCGLEDAENEAARAICDACRQEWHFGCHTPPLAAAPGGSQRWLCADCTSDGEPATPSWSLRACALCMIKQKGERQFLRVEGKMCETACRNSFDHPLAVRRLNEEVDAVNASLRDECEVALDSMAIQRTAAHAVAHGGLTVVSYCDGKGTLLGVLLRRGLRVRRYLSIECDENASRVCFALYGGDGHSNLAPGGLRFVVDARQLTIEKLKALDCWPVHLLMGATPCDDLSGCKAGAVGLEGPNSRLFKDFCSFLDRLRNNNGGVELCFMAENVKPVRLHDQDEMLRSIRVPPLLSEAAVFEASRRRRLFFSNMPFVHVPLETPNILLQSILNPGAIALSPKAGCIISSTMAGGNESIASAKAASQRNRGRELVLTSAHGTEVRGLLVPELAKALGQPFYEVDAAHGGSTEKCSLLGRSLAIGQISHALHTFIEINAVAQDS